MRIGARPPLPASGRYGASFDASSRRFEDTAPPGRLRVPSSMPKRARGRTVAGDKGYDTRGAIVVYRVARSLSGARIARARMVSPTQAT